MDKKQLVIEILEGYEIDKLENNVVTFKAIKSKYPINVKEIEHRDYLIKSEGFVTTIIVLAFIFSWSELISLIRIK